MTPDEGSSPVLPSSEEPQEPAAKKSRIAVMRENGFFRRYFVVIFFVFVGSVIIYAASRLIPAFGEFMARYPSQWIRFLLAKLTGVTHFSLAECLLLSLPLLAVAYIVFSSRSTKKDESPRNFYRWLHPLLSAIMVVLIIFFTAFGPSYGRYTLARNLGLSDEKVSASELYDTAVKVSKLLSEDIDCVGFVYGGESVMPYDYDTLVGLMNDAFGKYAEKVDYISHFSSYPKPISLSKPMTYTHISGVYTFMTGESNINTNYPDFLMPFTMAHEMSHQRGIAREDEANFVAFLVCISSDDAYVRYSGYANMLDYLKDALYSADRTLYYSFASEYLPGEVQGEYRAFSVFFDKYRDSTASAVTGAVNNTFLQSQGQTAGTKSYGLVVDLAVAYYKNIP